MKVLSFGELLFDHIEGVHYLGGAPANFAGHSAKLGATSYLVSAVGHDSLGTRAIQEITRHGVDPRFISQNNYATGTVEVTLQEGIPSYHIEYSAWDHIALDDVHVDELMNTHYDVFYYGSLAQRSRENSSFLLDLLEHTSYNDTFFDVNLRQRFFSKETLKNSLVYTTIIKLNDEELPVISTMLYGEELLPTEFYTRLHKTYPIRIMLLTCGKDGAYYFSKKDTGHIVPETIPVVDTVGAGDSFSAGFMRALHKTGDVSASAVFAAKLANHVISKQGALPDYPNEILEQLRTLG